MRGIAAAALAAVLALAGAADARQHFPARGHRILARGAPLDAFTAPAGAYSMRKLRSAYAGPAIRLRRASDNAELDINFLGCTGFTGCPIDTAAATAHCAATSCFIPTCDDQSGNSRDWLQLTAANQPQFVANCVGGLPCGRSATFTTKMVATGTGNVTPVMPVSLNAVTMRNIVSPNSCWPVSMLDNFGNQIFFDTTANRLSLGDNTSFIRNTAATDGAWHVAVGVINGASSVLRVDSTEVTGSISGLLTAGQFMGVNNTTSSGVNCDQTEAIIWNGYALTPGERAALQANQKSFWGTP